MKQQEHLRALRKRLYRLRRRRRWFRRAAAASAVAIALLLALAGVFALDWCFERNVDVWQRLLLLGLAAAATVWAFVRFAVPWLGKREDIVELALLVERQTGIDSDLVAALEFESPEAPTWGSPQLETAVIDRVAARQRNVNVMAAMPRQPLARRLLILTAVAALWALVVVIAPGHVRVFFQRLAMGSQHYPSRTQLVAVSVNGKKIDLAVDNAVPKAAIHVPFGQTVRFEATAAGAQPAAGRVELFTSARASALNVALERAPGDGPQSEYRGSYPGLNQSARCQISLGDAWTDPLVLSVLPLPVVEMEADVVPPDYARQSVGEVRKLPRGMRQFAVLAGSEVRLRLNSDRPLSAAEVTIDKKPYAMQRGDGAAAGASTAKSPQDATAVAPEVWYLPVRGTPLASLANDLAFLIQIHDAEGQTLEQPLEGSIMIEPDQPPSILATSKTPIVLPTGSPSVHYEANDDHALSSVWITWEATVSDTDASQAVGDGPTSQKREGRIEVCHFSPESPSRSRVDDYRLPLQSLPLKPGDTLKVTFHAADYRGPAAAATTDADPPLIFQVTDLHGFEASMYEADQKSASALEDIRRKHSGLGESP